MYYELYIEIFFLINFMMDSLLMLAVKSVLRCPVKNSRVYLGAAAGSVLACLLTAVPLPAALKIPACYVGVNVVMLKVGLKIQNGREFWKAFVLLYVTAFLMGGILQAFRPWLRTGSLFFAAAVPAYYLLCGIWRYLACLGRRQGRICEVVLHMGIETYRVHALLDTGNGLTDPLSGEPVSVLNSNCAWRMLQEEGKGLGIRYIPYRTVSGEGIMPVFRAKQMDVFLPEEKGAFKARRPVIGICEGQVSGQGEYQMILNPDVLAS